MGQLVSRNLIVVLLYLIEALRCLTAASLYQTVVWLYQPAESPSSRVVWPCPQAVSQ